MAESRSRELVLPLDYLEHDAEVTVDHLVDRGNQRLRIGEHEDAERNQNGGDALYNLRGRQGDLCGAFKALGNSSSRGAEVGVLGHGVVLVGIGSDTGRVASTRIEVITRLAWQSGSWSVFHQRR